MVEKFLIYKRCVCAQCLHNLSLAQKTFQPNHSWHQLKSLAKVPLFCVKQRSCKHCFKTEWTLELFFIHDLGAHGEQMDFKWMDVLIWAMEKFSLWTWRWRRYSTFFERLLELVSKELNHLAAILHVYAGSLIFMK